MVEKWLTYRSYLSFAVGTVAVGTMRGGASYALAVGARRARGFNKFSSVPLELCGSAAAAPCIRVTPILSFMVGCVTLCHASRR